MTVRLTTQPLVVAPLLAAVQSEANGGTALFLGTVRRSAEDGEVAGIAYSAYEAMAEEELERIVSEAREHWPGAAVDVRHRLGYVATGEASVAVAAAAPHRADAFAACRWVVDEVKRRAPIWKKEHLDGGAARWVEPAHA